MKQSLFMVLATASTLFQVSYAATHLNVEAEATLKLKPRAHLSLTGEFPKSVCRPQYDNRGFLKKLGEIRLNRMTKCQCEDAQLGPHCSVDLGNDFPDDPKYDGLKSRALFVVGDDHSLWVDVDELAESVVLRERERSESSNLGYSWNRGQCSQHLYQHDYFFCRFLVTESKDIVIDLLMQEVENRSSAK